MDYIYGGYTDAGYHRKINEDYIDVKKIDEDVLFMFVGDGIGSENEELQPSAIISLEMFLSLQRNYKAKKDLFLENTEFFLKDALYNANRVIGGIKLGNEECYGGFASSVTCCIVYKERVSFVHCGNTRLYWITTNSKTKALQTKQLTTDHTKGQQLVDQGIIPADQYYLSPDRLSMYSGVGVATEMIVQNISFNLKDGDMLLLTTDGVHYAIKKDAITDIIFNSSTCEDATNALVNAAKTLKYVDNASALLLWNKK